jgi:hypothetical protein
MLSDISIRLALLPTGLVLFILIVWTAIAILVFLDILYSPDILIDTFFGSNVNMLVSKAAQASGRSVKVNSKIIEANPIITGFIYFTYSRYDTLKDIVLDPCRLEISSKRDKIPNIIIFNFQNRTGG